MGGHCVRVLLIAAILVADCGFAQFSSLSTPADGSALFFSTALKEKNTSEPTYGKIFRLDSLGLHLLYSRNITDTERACSNAYDLTRIAISSDGDTQALTGQCSCLNGNQLDVYNCIKSNRFTTTVTNGGQSRDYRGEELWLSPSGRVALARGAAALEFSPYIYGVFDLSTGETRSHYPPAGTSSFALIHTTVTAARPVISNTGIAVLNPGVVLSGGVIQQIPPPSKQVTFDDATIDASGRTILVTAFDSLTKAKSVRITSPGALTTDLLVADGYLPSMSEDGQRLVYLSDRTGVSQVYGIGIDGKDDRQLTSEPDGVRDAILSGNGWIAYALTLGGRLLRISLSSGDVKELIPRTPYLDVAFPTAGLYVAPLLAPGKLSIITGGGLADGSYAAQPPLPESLAGVSVSVQSHPARIANVSPFAIELVAPADAKPDSLAKSVFHFEDFEAGTFSPFEASFDVSLWFYPYAPESVKTVHEDWSAPVSDQNPARPGEIVHTYAVGLGATFPPVDSGAAAPTREPLARLSTPLECRNVSSGNSGPPVEVTFAGLAPGNVGVYQVDWRVPPGLKVAGAFVFGCPNWEVVIPVASATDNPRLCCLDQ